MLESGREHPVSLAITIGVFFGLMISVAGGSALGTGPDVFTMAGGAIGAFVYLLYGGTRLRDCGLAGGTALVAGLVVTHGGMIGALLSVAVAWLARWICTRNSGSQTPSQPAVRSVPTAPRRGDGVQRRSRSITRP